jgi:uncharacterized alkaline shock family protein YloU
MSYQVTRQEGTITVTPSALAGLVAAAAESVDGAEVRRGKRRLEVDIDDRSARVRLELAARYGVVLPELARAVQERVADALTKMCSVSVEAVDISVEEVR